MKTIPLTKGYEAIVDDEDYEMLNKFKWHAHVSRRMIYATNTTKRDLNGKQKTIRMHSLLMHPPRGLLVDHIDGNGLNNQKSNLMVVTNRINCAHNHNRSNGSKYPGVTWERRRKHWVAQAQIDGKHVHIGSFPTEELAYEAYCMRVNPLEMKILSNISPVTTVSIARDG